MVRRPSSGALLTCDLRKLWFMMAKFHVSRYLAKIIQATLFYSVHQSVELYVESSTYSPNISTLSLFFFYKREHYLISTSVYVSVLANSSTRIPLVEVGIDFDDLAFANSLLT